MLPNFGDMMMFVSVVDEGSFTKAAGKLGCSRASVSLGVKRLEKSTRVQLLRRSTRTLSLTEPGLRFYRHCRQVCSEYKKAVEEVRNTHSDLIGQVTVAAPNAICRALVLPSMNRFLSDFPAISLKLHTDDLPVDLIDKRIDVAIRVGRIQTEKAMVTKIGETRDILCASASYIERKGGMPQSFEVLSEWDFITNFWQGGNVEYLGPNGEAIKVVPRIVCNSAHDVLDFVRCGAGVGYLPYVFVKDDMKAGDILALLPMSYAARENIYAMHKYDGSPPPAVSKLIGYLKSDLLEQRCK